VQGCHWYASTTSASLDGFGTGEGQALDAPFGYARTRLLQWALETRTFHAMRGEPGGSAGVDGAFARGWSQGIGAEIMGRGKFGPQPRPLRPPAMPPADWMSAWVEAPPRCASSSPPTSSTT
jgi:hypothetical protein